MLDDPEPEEDRERDLARRSGNPVLGPWLIVGLLLLAGGGAYVAFALFP
ncbi:hypothetical protein ACFPIF_07845 [Brevundimonas faecalis]